MMLKNIVSTAIAAGAFLVSASAIAASTVTFSPTATNGGAGAVGTAANFSAVGFQSNLASTLKINGNSGAQSYLETGVISLTSFRDAADAAVVSGVGTDYTLQAAFTLSGSGTWAGNVFAATAGTTTFSIDFWANGIGSGLKLGTAALDPFGPQVALAFAFGSLAPGASGTALTSLTADLKFTPTSAAFTGVGGFFEAPFPLSLSLSVGNAGGNTSNTGYKVAADGSVSFIVPTPGANQGTANVTFQTTPVPEPGVLSLAGIALVGVAASRRRKTAKAIA